MNREKLLCCALAVCLTLASGSSSGQEISFRESGRARTEYTTGQFPRNAIGTGDFNNDGLPDVASGSAGAVSVLLALADGSGFEGAQTVAVSGTVASLAIGDVNRDGKLDIVIGVSFSSNPLALLRGNGDGTFQPAVSIPAGLSSPASVALVDVNADDRLDLVVTSEFGTLYVLLGNGDGTFQTPRTTTLGNSAGSIAYGDFNGDGRVDLAIPVSGSVMLLLGNGDGTFQSPRTVASGGTARIAVAGDFNGDEKLDLAVLQTNSVAIVLGNGNGSFQTPRLTAIATDSGDIKAGDINSDGALDVVVTFCPFSGPPPSVAILFGNGSGTLQAPVSTTTFGCTAGVALDDFDLDGNLDVVANKNFPNGTVMLLPGNGDGTLGPRRPATGNNPNSIAQGDFNEDGIVDFVVSNNSSNTISLFLGNGDTTFQQARNLSVGLGPTSVAVGDINNDGHLDVLVANANSDDVSVLRGRGDGSFISLGAVLVGSIPLALVLGDLNRDGNLDIAVARSGGQLSVLLGNGNGTFQAPMSSSSGASNPSSMALADLNGDGIDDLVVTDVGFTSNSLVVLLGIGNGTFQAPRRFTTGRNPTSVAVGDLNGDGIPDLAVSTNVQSVTVLLGIGDGTFQPGVDFFVLGTGLAGVALGDFNADGRLDIATVNASSNNVSILLNNEVPKAAVFAPVSFIDVGEFSVGSNPRAIVASDFNADGLPDLAVANFTSNDVAVLFNTTR